MAACPNFAAAFRSTRLLAGGLRGLAGARNHLARRTPRSRQVIHLLAGGEGARRNRGREVARREDGVHELLSLLDVVIGAKTAAARMLR